MAIYFQKYHGFCNHPLPTWLRFLLARKSFTYSSTETHFYTFFPVQPSSYVTHYDEHTSVTVIWQTFLVLFLTKYLILGFQFCWMWLQGQRFPTFRRNYWSPEDERDAILQNVDNHIPSDATSQPRRPKFWAAPLWKRQNSHNLLWGDLKNRRQSLCLGHQQNKQETLQKVDTTQQN